MNADLIERLRGPSPSIPAMRDAADEIGRLRARIDNAPSAFMDTRTALGLCAPTEADFPALYALQGKPVALVVLEHDEVTG